MNALLETAIACLKDGGADYGDARIGLYKFQNLSMRDRIATNLSTNRSEGIGIQARIGNGWGFFATQNMTSDGIRKAADRALEIARASSSIALVTPYAEEPIKVVKWTTPFDIDPFSIPIKEKLAVLEAINDRILNNKGINRAVSTFSFRLEHKYFMNTLGCCSDQLLMRVDGAVMATAVGKNGFETRNFNLMPLNTGYEQILMTPWVSEAERVAEEAVEKLNSPECPEGIRDLVLLPTHTCLVIHETIGHATELDRVMGWEADMAGTSFATIDQLNHLKYGSSIFNVIADRTQKNGRSTVVMDDEGVEPREWHLIRDGVLTGYSTTRGTAHYVGETRSRGCSYADSWSSAPILRMPNVSIEPGVKGSPSLEELIADTEEGILVDGMGSFSIDHQRINFQFGGDAVWRIEHGKKSNMLRGFTYQSRNPDFWNSVDAICHQDEWRKEGVVNCGKGQPMQVAQLTHGSSPLRLRKVAIGKARV